MSSLWKGDRMSWTVIIKRTDAEAIKQLNDWANHAIFGKLKPNTAAHELINNVDAHPSLKKEWLHKLSGKDGENYKYYYAVKKEYDSILEYKAELKRKEEAI